MGYYYEPSHYIGEIAKNLKDMIASVVDQLKEKELSELKTQIKSLEERIYKLENK